jgi:hypothetical protein
MNVPENPETVKNGKVSITDDDILYPAIDIRILPGKYSQYDLLGFNWTYVNFTKTEL